MFIPSLAHSLTHSPTYPRTHSLTHSFTHSGVNTAATRHHWLAICAPESWEDGPEPRALRPLPSQALTCSRQAAWAPQASVTSRNIKCALKQGQEGGEESERSARPLSMAAK